MPGDTLNLLENLPEEMTLAILAKVQNNHDMSSIRLTSKKIKRIYDDHYWKVQYQRFFGHKLPKAFPFFSYAAFKHRMDETLEIIANCQGMIEHDRAICRELVLKNSHCNPSRIEFPITALIALASAGFLLGINQLLTIPTFRNVAHARENITFTCAASNGHLDVVNKLLTIEAVRKSIAARDNFALVMTSQNGHLDVIERLLEFSDVVDKVSTLSNLPLRLASQYRHLPIVNRLLEFPIVKINADQNCNNAMIKAAEYGHADVLARLLKIDVVKDRAGIFDNRALRLASKNGSLPCVNLLLEVDSVKDNATAMENKALRLAVKYEKWKVVNRLLELDNVCNHVLQHQETWPNYIVEKAFQRSVSALTIAGKQYTPSFACIRAQKQDGYHTENIKNMQQTFDSVPRLY